MPDYLFPHPNAGWRYHRKVPKALRAAIGRDAWVSYIKVQPRPSALAEARQLAVKHDALITALRRMTGDERAEIASSGGWATWEARAREHDLMAYLARLVEADAGGEHTTTISLSAWEKGRGKVIDEGTFEVDPDVLSVKMRRHARNREREAAVVRRVRRSSGSGSPLRLLWSCGRR
jgi:hypothetical protein